MSDSTSVVVSKSTARLPLHVSWLSLMTSERWIEVTRIGFMAIMAFLFWRDFLPVPVLWISVAIGLYPLVKTGLVELVRERKIGTEVFVTIATIVALLGGEAAAGAVLLAIILVAEFIAELNMDRARVSIKDLIGSVPQSAILRTADGEQTVPITQLQAGDIVLARAGDRISVDGIVIHGNASLDEAPITGESIPRDKQTGDQVFAGTIVTSGALDIRTEKVGGDTTFSRIIALVEDAESEHAPVQKLADKVATWLIPAVFIFLTGVYLVTHDVRMIVTLLIFTSPAELGLATPLVMIAALARAARSGILVKGGLYLELLARVDAVVFDKTGTLTANKPVVVRIKMIDSQFALMEFLKLAAAADRRSSHPLATAVLAYAAEMQAPSVEPTTFEQLAGRGVHATVDDRIVLVGNEAMLREAGVDLSHVPEKTAETPVHVAVDGKLVGIIYIADQVRPGARETLMELKRSGVRRTVMLTGDNALTAQTVAATLGIDEVHANLLPSDKVDVIFALQRQGYRVAMVGDGINDAPALARSDVGIAMGGGGTQVALEAADIVLMTDDLSKIAVARAIARRAYRTIQENLFVGVGVVHVLGITAALLGWIGPIQAAILHLGPDILVFLNSAKLLNVRIRGA